MKKINIAFFSILIFLLACQQERNPHVAISGVVTNMEHDSIIFIQGEDRTTFKIDADGKYSGELKNKSGYTQFLHSKYPLTFYLDSDNPMVINFDAKQPYENLEYQGEGSAASIYLSEKNLLLKNIGSKLRGLYSKNESEFISGINLEKELFLKLLTSKEGLSDQFLSDEKTNIDYEFASYIRDYEPAHRYFAKQPNFVASETLQKQWRDLDMDDEEKFKMIPSYAAFVSEYYSGIEMPAVFDSLKNANSPFIKSSIANTLSEYISLSHEDLDSTFETLQSMAIVPNHKKTIKEKYDRIKGLTTGADSPQFDYENVFGKQIKLEDLKGKNVYIDVWATWCGPCLAEIPSLKKLESEYHGKNIEFVSISVDEPVDKDLWRETVSNKELKGVQLITENGWNSEFVENYLINGIPRFILLDESGKIVSADAPRPSSDGLIKGMIDELL